MTNDFASYHEMVKWQERLAYEGEFFKEILSEYDPASSLLLDLGCGEGFHLLYFAKEWGYSAIGIDSNEKVIQTARKLAEHQQVTDKVHFFHGDILDLESIIKNQTFDIVFNLGNSMALFTEKERDQIINEVSNHLKKDGRFIIQVVNYLRKRNESEWIYKPSISRLDNNMLGFYVRMMEWVDNKHDKIRMHVFKAQQTRNTEEESVFETTTRVTHFYALRKKDFSKYKKQFRQIETLGSYKKKKFDVEQSRDILAILKK